MKVFEFRHRDANAETCKVMERTARRAYPVARTILGGPVILVRCIPIEPAPDAAYWRSDKECGV
jgi:hypothetical protein